MLSQTARWRASRSLDEVPPGVKHAPPMHATPYSGRVPQTPLDPSKPPRQRISVAICTYNGARFVRAQLQSILEQSHPADEVVIADDGSTDDTLAIVAQVVAAYNGPTEIKVAHTDRVGGVVRNFERALRATSGDVIALSDHDDVWREDRIAKGLAALPDSSIPGLVFSDARLIDDEGHSRGRTLFEAYSVDRRELDLIHGRTPLDALVWRNIVTGATVMFTRPLLDMALPFPRAWVHDEWLAAIAACLGRVDVIEDQLVDYRIHGTNEIGVPPESRVAQARVALRGGRARHTQLLGRVDDLFDRVVAFGAPPSIRHKLLRKLVFESLRERYFAVPGVRAVDVIRVWRQGYYKEFAKTPAIEAVRDTFQRP